MKNLKLKYRGMFPIGSGKYDTQFKETMSKD